MKESGRLTRDDLPDPAAYGRFHPFLRGVFSQWHPSGFELDGVKVCCAEQWMMLSKARLFDDEARAAAILATEDPAEQKRIGQQVEGFDTTVWNVSKVDIVFRGSLAKFTQNPGAARQLRATEDAMLVEANPRDWIWGCGLSEDDAGISDPTQWRGENLLGRILTLVRERIGG